MREEKTHSYSVCFFHWNYKDIVTERARSCSLRGSCTCIIYLSPETHKERTPQGGRNRVSRNTYYAILIQHTCINQVYRTACSSGTNGGERSMYIQQYPARRGCVSVYHQLSNQIKHTRVREEWSLCTVGNRWMAHKICRLSYLYTQLLLAHKNSVLLFSRW